jgi:predicted ester cyclase
MTCAAVQALGGIIPDLKWDVKEVIEAGDKIVVRSVATGTPVAELFGVPASGKSFNIYAIDIHTVVDGKLARCDHVEDWTTALGQLKA